MKSTSQGLAVALALGAALAAATASAQNKGNPQRETLKASGTIQAMAGGVIQMVTEDGEQWLIKVEARPDSLWYYAEAEPSWLKPGMLVRFSGRFNKQGVAEGTIGSLAVVSPSPDVRPGIKVDTGLTAGAELFTDPKPKAAPKPQTVAADVVGKLAAMKDGELRVAAPGVTVRGQLGEKAVISVEMLGLQMAKVGDSIEVNGWYPPGMKGRAIANRVVVRAQQPLKGYVKPPRTPAKPAESGDDDDYDPLNGPK